MWPKEHLMPCFPLPSTAVRVSCFLPLCRPWAASHSHPQALAISPYYQLPPLGPTLTP